MSHARCPRCTAPVGPADQFCAQCGQPVSTADRGLDRLVDGRFRIVEKLGSGGMADVFLAEQTTVQRSVALKLLRPEYTDDGHHERFRREALAASRLNHPATITIYDFGRAENRLYIAMEYVQGITLHRALRGGLEWPRAVEIARQVAGSLGDAHAQGVVHRDLKSENVMLYERGGYADQVKVLDFGIAKLLHPDGPPESVLSTPNLVLGTPAVIAPELLLGQAVTPSSDIYSLGVVLYQMLAGRLPFRSRDVSEIVRRQLYSAPPALVPGANVELPPPLVALVEQMMAKSPDERPRSMDEVQERLTELARRSEALEPQWSEHGILGVDTTAPPAAPPASARFGPAVERLLDRLTRAPDFPAFAGSVNEINAACSDPDTSAQALADTILRDYGVTEKLLRLANSAFYRRHNQETTTVSRAVVMLGFEQVRRIALSLVYWNHLEDTAQRDAMQGSAVRSLSSAVIARDLADEVDGVDPEEAFICSMFRAFGRQLVAWHLPEEAAQVRAQVAEGVSEYDAAIEVLGGPYEEIGAALAQQLAFPPRIARSMRTPRPEEEGHPDSPVARLRVLSAFSNAVATELDSATPSEEKLRALVRRYGPGLKVTPERLDDALARASEQLAEYGAQVDMNVQGSGIAETLAWRAARDTEPVPARRLRLYLDRLREADAPLEDAVRLTLEGLMNAGVDRALFGLKNFKNGRMTGRVGLGEGVRPLLKRFAFDLEGQPDLFRVALARGRELVVEDTRLPSVRQRLPAWYMEIAEARSLALYPVTVRGVSVGLLYLDARGEGAPWLDREMQVVVRGLRDVLLEAFIRLGRRGRPPG